MNSQNKPIIATVVLYCVYVVFFAASGIAQEQASQQDQGIPASALTTKSVQAVGYEVGAGSTKVDLKGTELMSQASGEAKVEITAKAGRANVEVNVKGLMPPSTLGAEFLTYVGGYIDEFVRTGDFEREIDIVREERGTLRCPIIVRTVLR